MLRPHRMLHTGVAMIVGAVLVTSACGDDSPDALIDVGAGDEYAPDIVAADFVDTVDNPYFPLTPGTSWTFEGTDGDDVEHIEVTVTTDREEVMGVPAVVVRDTVTIDGELVEDTYDWYAQDKTGAVWYLGEDTAEYENGEIVSTEGSWRAGVDGALPGVIMPAHPAVGDAYRQEYYEGEAEDMAEVVRVGAEASVPAGAYDDVVVIREWNPLEPDTVEEKYYAPGVGVVLEQKTTGGTGRVQLVGMVTATR